MLRSVAKKLASDDQSKCDSVFAHAYRRAKQAAQEKLRELWEEAHKDSGKTGVWWLLLVLVLALGMTGCWRLIGC